FIGTPAMNLVSGPVVTESPTRVTGGTQVGFRPLHAVVTPLGEQARGGEDTLQLDGIVEYTELLGDDVLVTITGVWGQAHVLRGAAVAPLAEGTAVEIRVPAARLHWFDAQGRRCR